MYESFMDFEGSCVPNQNMEPALYTIGVITDALSIAGSIFVILIYSLFKESRNYAYLLIVQLAIADIISAIGDLVNTSELAQTVQDVDASCVLQGFLTQFGTTASFVWTMIISWTLYATVILNRLNIFNMLNKKLAVGYGIPFLAALIPLMSSDYGSVGHWCWITIQQSPVRGNILRFLLFYIPLWVGIAFNFYCYYKVIRFLKRVIPGSHETAVVLRLRLYPLILIFCWIWATVYQIYGLIDCRVDNRFLNVASLGFSNMIGFFNALAYGLNENIQQILVDKVKSLCKWLTKPFRKEKKVTKAAEHKKSTESTYSDYGVEMGTPTGKTKENDLEMSFTSAL